MIHLSFHEDAYGIWSWELRREDVPLASQGGFPHEHEVRDGFRNLAAALFTDASTVSQNRIQELAFNAKVFGPDGEERPRPETAATHEVKAKNLRVGYEVKAPGAPAWSRISKVERDDQAGGNVGVDLPWGHMDFEPDELVEVKAEILHPRIVDDKGAEIGVGSMIKGGDSDAGELVELVEPDESHWGVLVKWPEFDEPERFEASPNDPSEDPLYCSDVEAI